MKKDTPKHVTRIIKLLDFNPDNATEQEVEAAQKLAKKLMAKHQISLKDIKEADMVIKTRTFPLDSFPEWFVILMNEVAYFTGVVFYFADCPEGCMVIFTGRREDVEQAAYLSEALIYKVIHAYKKWVEEAKPLFDSQHNGYLCGLATNLGERMRSLVKTVMPQRSFKEGALALVEGNEKKQEAAAAFFERDSPAPSRMVADPIDPLTYQVGLKDGEEINIHAPLATKKEEDKSRLLT